MSFRAALSKMMISRFEKGTPTIFRSIELRILTDLAAKSFGIPKSSIKEAGRGSALDRYASFTCMCMEDGETEPELLFHQAYELGRKIRRLTGLTDEKDLRRLTFLLYHNIGIIMTGDLPGEITVSECRFARYYSPEQCRLMSNVDSGIISGIYGGGRLRFESRITEGCDCCLGRFVGEEETAETTL